MSLKIASATLTIRTFAANLGEVAKANPTTAKTEEPKGGAGPELPGQKAKTETVPGAPSSSVGLPSVTSAEKIRVQGRTGHSIGDPHVRTGDGLDFDNMREGKFIKARSESGDFEVQTEQTKPDPNKNVTVNTAAAVKAGKDVVNYNSATNQLTVNGEAKSLKDGESLDLPDGGKLSRSGNDYQVTTTKGDKVDMKNMGGYLDVYTTVGEDRASGEVRGEVGNFDADTDTSNDMLGRDGQQLGTDKLDQFLDEWTVKDGESLFDADKGGAQPQGGAGAVPGGEQIAQNAQNAEIERTLKGFLEGLKPEDLQMLGNFLNTLMGAAGKGDAAAQPAAQADQAEQAAPAAQAPAAEEPQGGAAAPAAAPQAEKKEEEEEKNEDGLGGFMQILQMLMKMLQSFQGQAGAAAPAEKEAA